MTDRRLAREIRVAKSGSLSTVVWNPWIEKAARLGDMGDDGYRRMLCVETANAGDDVVTLAPRARHRLVTELKSAPCAGALCKLRNKNRADDAISPIANS